jgi:hypothetical protein
MDDFQDLDTMKDVYGDLNDFDQRLKGNSGKDPYDSGSDDDQPQLDSLAQ